MAFDKTLPNNATKIRNYPTVLQDNFKGIQEGDSTFIMQQINVADRTAGAILPETPAAIADTMLLFSKNDGSNTELYTRDPDGNIIQVTTEGSLGNTSTNLEASQLKFSDDFIFTPSNGFINAWAYCNGGTVLYNYHLPTIATVGTGIYTLTTSAVFNNANICLLSGVTMSGTDDMILSINGAPTIAASKITFRVETVNRSSGSHKAVRYWIAIIGGI
jgi:hypothetical protein